MGKFDRLKNYASNKYNEIKEDRRKTKEINKRVKAIEKRQYYKELEHQKGLRAIENAERKAKRSSRPRLERAANTSRAIARSMPKLKRNGPDPFGLFSDGPQMTYRQPRYVKRMKKRRSTGDGFNKDDYLNNLM